MRSATALLIVDFINPLVGLQAGGFAARALAAARATARLAADARRAGMPLIYANDHFGKWHWDFRRLIEECREGERCRAIVELLEPTPQDFAVLKPRHSAFYGTPLEFLLDELRAECLIITGLTTDSCVLFTAGDAFLRGFKVWVPAECVAATSAAAQRRALAQIESVAKVWTGVSTTPIRTGVTRAVKLHDK